MDYDEEDFEGYMEDYVAQLQHLKLLVLAAIDTLLKKKVIKEKDLDAAIKAIQKEMRSAKSKKSFLDYIG